MAKEFQIPRGKRVLVVEDEALIAMFLEDLLRDHGCVVVGPVHDVESALGLVRSTPIDAAILDLNIAGRTAYPVADALRTISVPIVFCTGSGRDELRQVDQSSVVLRKPFVAADVMQALVVLLT